MTLLHPLPQPEAGFLRGDYTADGVLLINDAINMFGYLFNSGAASTCADAADVDDDGALGIGDVIQLLGYLFGNNVVLPAPGPINCGADPTVDTLPECVFDNCP